MRKEAALWAGMGLMVGALVLAGILAGYHRSDVSMIHYASHPLPIRHWAGAFGAQVAAFLLYSFGLCAWLVLAMIFGLGFLCIRSYFERDVYVWYVPAGQITGLWMAIFGFAGSFHLLGWELYRSMVPGGKVGYAFVHFVGSFLDKMPTSVLTGTLLFAGLILLFGLSPLVVLARGARWALWQMWRGVRSGVRALYHRYAQRKKPVVYASLEWLVQESVDPLCSEEHYKSALNGLHVSQKNKMDELTIDQLVAQVLVTDMSQKQQTECSLATTYHLPSVADLASVSAKVVKDDGARHEGRARVIEEKLRTFGIDGRITSVSVGPVVVVYEFLPAIYVKVSRIVAFEDDLALALEAHSLRIISPVPGQATVRLEVSRSQDERAPVHFKSLCEQVLSKESTKTKFFGQALPALLGCDVVGDPFLIDLATLPHLLIAGATGSGKSVVLHSCIASLLMTKTPAELGIILIDPKQLECAMYQTLPHMVFAPITSTPEAIKALMWMIGFMEDRYKAMAASGARTFEDFVRMMDQPQQRIVLIIDELADLMLTAGKEIELHLARLAQMGRAAGIHLIFATQRPSVDVLTGLIKANFPARLALKVASKIDSRIIIDMYGAQSLLGKGDMLFLSPQGACTRVHGAYVTSADVEKLVSIHADQQESAFHQFNEFAVTTSAHGAMGDDEDPVLYQQVRTYVATREDVSISLLQRQFRIGFNRSARLIDQLERDGLVSSAQGAKTRKVLR